MNTLNDYLQQEQDILQKQIRFLQERMKTYPENILEVSHNNKKYVQYYRRDRCISGKKEKRTYIKKSEMDIAYKLAQRDYDRRLLSELIKREKIVTKAELIYNNTAPEEVFHHFSEERQSLIKPLILPDERYIKEWLSESYEGKPFDKEGPEIITANGERVRSKSEKIIADTLARYEIPYKYECPLILSNGITVYPDFRVLHVRLRKELIWDHFGLMGNQEYSVSVARKINEYISSGYYPGDQLIFTMEGVTVQLNTRIIEMMIEKYLV